LINQTSLRTDIDMIDGVVKFDGGRLFRVVHWEFYLESIDRLQTVLNLFY
jgi:hypothetical protein